MLNPLKNLKLAARVLKDLFDNDVLEAIRERD